MENVVNLDAVEEEKTEAVEISNDVVALVEEAEKQPAPEKADDLVVTVGGKRMTFYHPSKWSNRARLSLIRLGKAWDKEDSLGVTEEVFNLLSMTMPADDFESYMDLDGQTSEKVNDVWSKYAFGVDQGN